MNKPQSKSSISQDAQERSEEKELVQRAKSGDEDAFRQLFETHNRRAFALALGVVRNPTDALDVVQDAFIKAHRYLPNFQGTSSFYTWLYRIVMNLCIDHLRKKKRAKQVDFNDAIAHLEGQGELGSEGFLPQILGADPAKSLARKEIRKNISDALESLSDNHRAVLVMRELEGLSYEEMADTMKCSKGTIMSRLFHARKNMQELLISMMGEEVES